MIDAEIAPNTPLFAVAFSISLHQGLLPLGHCCYFPCFTKSAGFNMARNADSNREFISTAQAARQLGLSLGAVQQMVESGTLAGWKTAGGHRRIRQDSVDALLARSQQSGAARPRAGGNKLRVVVVEDDSLLQTIYRETLANWPMNIELCVLDHGLDALVELGREPPDLLIADLRMPGLDGFEMIRRLRENPVATEIAIVVVSALTPDEIQAEGGLPEDVTVYRKPVPFHELHGYMQALIAQRKRTRNALGTPR